MKTLAPAFKVLTPALLRSTVLLGSSVAIAYFSACLFVLFRQNRFIFLPSTTVEITPEFYNLRYQDVWLPVTNRSGRVSQLHGWWIPAVGRETGVLLYLHGNGINIGANAGQASLFHQLGFSVLLIDYRGYGRSDGGFPSEAKVYQDAEAAWNYLVQERRVRPEQIFLYGHSLGGAISIDLAVQHPEAAGLIVQSSFTSMRDMANLKGWGRLFPVNLLLTQRFDSLSKVQSLKLPVLFIHGTEDFQVPAYMSQLLFANTPEPRQLVLVPGANHNNVAEIGGSRYLEALQQFIRQNQNHQTPVRQTPAIES